MLQTYIASKRSLIVPFTIDFLQKKKVQQNSINPWVADAYDRLIDFVPKGKLLRGVMTFLGFELFNKPDNNLVLPVAAANEIFQSAILIHDDIMDNDRIRRGSQSLFAQYEKKLINHEHTSQSLAMCVGDIGFFLGFELLNKVPDSSIIRIIELYTNELTKVGFAQMQDVYRFPELENTRNKNSGNRIIEDILNIYRYKTGRYTCGLPLVAGAVLANQSQSVLNTLWSFGESLGILFQVKDDELGLFGTEKETGKPIVSDLKEGKKTLYYHFLFSFADNKTKKKLKTIFGNENINNNDIAFVQSTVKKLDIEKQIAKTVGPYRIEFTRALDKLTGNNTIKTVLEELANYIINRKR